MKASVSTPTQTQNLTYMNWIPVKIQFMSTLLWDDDIKVSKLNGCGVIVSLMLIITCWFVCECLCIALLLWWSQWFCLIRLFRLWVSLLINTVNLAVAAVVFLIFFIETYYLLHTLRWVSEINDLIWKAWLRSWLSHHGFILLSWTHPNNAISTSLETPNKLRNLNQPAQKRSLSFLLTH